jgi:hypothetical protein
VRQAKQRVPSPTEVIVEVTETLRSPTEDNAWAANGLRSPVPLNGEATERLRTTRHGCPKRKMAGSGGKS